MARSILAAALSLAMTGTALPQDLRSALAALDGTISVQSTPQMSDGKLTGCLLTFETMQQDFTYLKGNFFRISGSVGYMGAGANIGLVVKVVAVELDPDLPDMGRQLLELSRAYLVNSDLTTNYDSLIAAHPGENGGVFSIFQLEPGTTAIFEALEANRINIAFAVGTGSVDVQLPIELDVVDVQADGTRIRSPDAALGFMECTQALFAS